MKRSARAYCSTQIIRRRDAIKRLGMKPGIYISTRKQPEVLREQEPENILAKSATPMLSLERCSHQCGQSFKKFEEMTVGSERLTRRHVIVLSHFFGVSREAMVRRLEELALVKSGTWDWFQDNGGINNEQVRHVLGDLSVPDDARFDADRPTSLRLNLLAAEAYRRELLSEGQLARLLSLDRVELREILEIPDIDQSETDGIVADRHE
jgi:hypothetical protein